MVRREYPQKTTQRRIKDDQGFEKEKSASRKKIFSRSKPFWDLKKEYEYEATNLGPNENQKDQYKHIEIFTIEYENVTSAKINQGTILRRNAHMQWI